jgi:hypothetical protein
MKAVRTGAVVLMLMVSVRLFGQIQITEIAYEEWYRADADGDYGAGWVEVKNVSGAALNTSDFKLVLNNHEPWQLPDAILNPGGYWMIWFSGKDRNTDTADLHASFTLEQKLNIVKIATTTTIDSLLVSNRPYWNESKARYPEDADVWFNVTTTTPGSANVAMGMWRRVSTFSEFFPRDSAPNGSLYFDGKFWILEGWPGGGGEEVSVSGVWNSVNCRDWQMVSETAPYNPYSSYVTFDGYMWAFDGSAFRSNDGITWTKVAENLPFTTHNRVTVFDDELVAVKGSSVYRSIDGINWTTQTSDAPWGYRELPGFVSFKEKLWLFGGAKNYFTGQDYYFTDVWSSPDGIQWTQEVYEADWKGRLWFGYKVFDDKIWLMGGWNYHDKENPNYGNRNDIWYTSNGTEWHQMNSAAVWPPRHAPFVWGNEDSMYVACGYLNTFGLFNDIWVLDRLSTNRANEFYLQNNQDPRTLASWGTNKSGTGFTPSGFDYDNQFFHVAGDDSVTWANDWGVSGLNTRAIIGDGVDSVDLELKPGIDITGDIELKAKTTMRISGNTQTPRILIADPESRISIRDGDSELNAASVGHLDVVDASVALSETCKVESSVSITGDVTIDGEAFQYKPGAQLNYSTESHDVSRSEWSHESYPSFVTVNVKDKLTLSNDARTNTLTFNAGKVRVDSASLLVGEFEGISDTTYIITGNEGYLKMPVGVSSRLFPVGTDTTYTPVEVSISDSDPEASRIIVVRTASLDTLRNQDFAVRTGWFFAEAGVDPRVGFVMNPATEYSVTANWPLKDQGTKVDDDHLAFKHLEQGAWVIQSSTNFSTDMNTARKALSSLVSDYGWFIVQDSRTNITATVTVYPNPASEYVEVGFKEPAEENVHINVFSITGQRVLQIDFEPGYNFYRIPLDYRLGDGLYILNIYTNGIHYSERILIQNQNSP